MNKEVEGTSLWRLLTQGHCPTIVTKAVECSGAWGRERKQGTAETKSLFPERTSIRELADMENRSLSTHISGGRENISFLTP